MKALEKGLNIISDIAISFFYFIFFDRYDYFILENKKLLKKFFNYQNKNNQRKFKKKFNLYLKRIQLSTKWYTTFRKKV
jgi:hypothetical protein